MKTTLIVLTFVLITCAVSSTAQVNKKVTTINSYLPKFQFRNNGGALHDTMLPPFMFKLWQQSATYPPYIQWQNLPLAIIKTGNRIGLFADSSTSFSAGDTVGYVFIKKTHIIGSFDADYVRSSLASFAHQDSATANVQLAKGPQGIVMIVKNGIAPVTEIIFNPADIFTLFPNDKTVTFAINAELK